MKNIIIAILSIAVVCGCGKSEQEKYTELQAKRVQEQPAAPQLTAEPEPTEIPTPVPRDSASDTIYSTHGNFLVSYGKGEWKDGILIYQTIEVEGDPQDIVWVMPSGVIIVSNKYKDRVKKIQ